MITAMEIIQKIEPHDQVLLDLLMVDRNQMTLIQIANRLKRSRLDVRGSIERLSAGGHIKKLQPYSKWCAVNYDYSCELAAKRPEEAVSEIDRLTEENKRLRDSLSGVLFAYESVVCDVAYMDRDNAYSAGYMCHSAVIAKQLLTELKGGEDE